MDGNKKFFEELEEIFDKTLEKFKDEDYEIKLMYLDKQIIKVEQNITNKMIKSEIDEQKVEEIIKVQETFLDKMKEILGDDMNE